MVCIQENSPRHGHGPFGLMAPLSWGADLIGRLPTRLARPPRPEGDLQRLAETSPHLLEDIGYMGAPASGAPHRPLWSRGP